MEKIITEGFFFSRYILVWYVTEHYSVTQVNCWAGTPLMMFDLWEH